MSDKIVKKTRINTTKSNTLNKGKFMHSNIVRPKPAQSAEALAHFQRLLAFETDCWDVHHAISNQRRDFILIDVRAQALFKQGHLPEAINIPTHQLKRDTLTQFSEDKLIVVYCAGPHCNGTEKAAIVLAKLNRPVKKMIGGITGWIDEGFKLVID